MIRFILERNLYVMAALGVGVAIYVGVNWEALTVLQRMSGLFFIGLVMHLWEEGRFPGGFVELITEHLHFTASSRWFGEVVTAAYVLVIAFVPLFFPNVPFLAMSSMMLGIMEVVMHTAMIRMFRMKHFYSPGLVTAAFVLFPISLYTFIYVIQHDLMRPLWWLFSFLYMLFGLMIAQQVVIRASGVKYADFLKTVRAAIMTRR
ncbi:HXXEE domain-containing protein [Rhizobium sp. NZLR1]|uniref:HXXEE domain-containing protein n=1 Tax=Rhizobium sp. NZLR1 TaxID=2731096 RepID=UPI001A991C93|nr:HXXEE domain-containing protein [Rhizobium sp. NZLR1]MBX5204683.1 HXXEE domain-containing protein [Rhizobium sp. NZLR1]QSZ23400.1 HXXEE domain-containing protein [Rhizobium sp. NZLR1]